MISTSGIAILLGKNSSPIHVISSVIFVIVLFFYIFSVGSYFQVEISPLENRINYLQPFLIYIFDKQIDQLIIVSGVVTWLALSLLKRPKIFIPVIYVGTTAIAVLGGSVTFD